MVSKSRDKIHQTWGPPISGALLSTGSVSQGFNHATFGHICIDTICYSNLSAVHAKRYVFLVV